MDDFVEELANGHATEVVTRQFPISHRPGEERREQSDNSGNGGGHEPDDDDNSGPGS